MIVDQLIVGILWICDVLRGSGLREGRWWLSMRVMVSRTIFLYSLGFLNPRLVHSCDFAAGYTSITIVYSMNYLLLLIANAGSQVGFWLTIRFIFQWLACDCCMLPLFLLNLSWCPYSWDIDVLVVWKGIMLCTLQICCMVVTLFLLLLVWRFRGPFTLLMWFILIHIYWL